MSTVVGVIFAGGVGNRLNQGQTPKQFLEVDGKPIIVHTIEQFQRHPDVDEVVISCVPAWIPHLLEITAAFGLDKVAEVVEGGATSQDSVRNGLLATQALYGDDTTVLIHDAVRPIITARLLSDLIQSVAMYGNGISCTPCHETVVVTNTSGGIDDVPVRRNTFTVQAPQAFRLPEILRIHDEIRRVNPSYEDMIDSCTMLRHLGLPVHLVHGNFGNIKVTYPEDVYILEALLRVRKDEDLIGVQLLDQPCV
jgi:2-C-methyl-D-erythritol 4-phosphate cytidylyltransferase